MDVDKKIFKKRVITDTMANVEKKRKHAVSTPHSGIGARTKVVDPAKQTFLMQEQSLSH